MKITEHATKRAKERFNLNERDLKKISITLDNPEKFKLVRVKDDGSYYVKVSYKRHVMHLVIVNRSVVTFLYPYSKIEPYAEEINSVLFSITKQNRTLRSELELFRGKYVVLKSNIEGLKTLPLFKSIKKLINYRRNNVL